MSFVVKNNAGTAQVVPDLGDLTLEAGEERDLLANGDYLTEQLSGSADLASFLAATTFDRLTGFGGSVIPAGQAFDDQTTDAHISDTSAHGLQIAVLANISDAGSGNVINNTERTKLSGIEAGAEVNDTGAEILTKLQGEPTPLGLDVATVDGANAAALRDRATHTGTQLASTISDFDSAADARITAQKGAVNGLAELDANGRVPSSQLTISAFEFKGNWNANTNSPTLTSGAGTQGDLYRVSVAGSTNLDGETDWQIGDQAVFDGTAWSKIDNTESVSSVNGQQGAVVLDTDDVGEGSSNLYFTEARVAAAPAVAANTAKVSADGSINTHSDVDTTGVLSGQLLAYNGSTWVPQNPQGETPFPAVQTRLTSTFAVPTGVWTTIPFDTRDVETDASSIENPAANPETFVVQDDTVPLQVVLWLNWNATTSDNFSFRLRIDGTTTVPGTEATVTTFDDFKPTGFTVQVPAALLSVGSVITAEVIENTGDVSLLSGTTLQALQLKGPRGEKGDPGAGSTINVQNDGIGLGLFDTVNFAEGLVATDAGGSVAQVVAAERYMYRGKTTNTTITGPYTVDVDELVRDTSGGDFTYSLGEFTCNFDGWAEASFDISLDCANNNRETSICWIELNGVAVDHTNAFGYHRNNANGEDTVSCQAFPIQVSNGDIIRVRANDATTGSLTVLANGCRIKLKRA